MEGRYFGKIEVMENTLSTDIKATITFKQSELGFVLQLLDALKLRGIVEFQLEKGADFESKFRQLTVKELNQIIEKAEMSSDISLEEFKSKHKL